MTEPDPYPHPHPVQNQNQNQNQNQSPPPPKKQALGSEDNLKKLLLEEFAIEKEYAVGALDNIFFDSVAGHPYKMASELLKGDQCKCIAEGPAGVKIYSLPEQLVSNSSILRMCLYDLKIRPSRLYFERGCYSRLFDWLWKYWKKTPDQAIVLTGNAGIGKSWFQVYFLRRLLTMKAEERPWVRFIVRQHENSYFLLDLNTCEAWKMTPGNSGFDLKHFFAAFKQLLYLFEPELGSQHCPVKHPGTPCLATVSPNPTRLKDYTKQVMPIYLYMPIWSLQDLEAVARLETNTTNASNSFNLWDQYRTYGGIIRYTLEYNSHVLQKVELELSNRIKTVDIDVMQSINAGIDDNSDGRTMNNISGFICSYADIPETGNDAFTKRSLSMTSQYVCEKIREKLGLASPRDHAKELLQCLNNKKRDITGINLEVTSAYLLAEGKLVSWEYIAVGSSGEEKEKAKPNKLVHKKMDVHRSEDIHNSKLNYPTNPTFGLVDFFFFSDDEWWAFQTTWQKHHPFKLWTLWSFRQKMGVDETVKVNVLYVVAPPELIATYAKRSKLKCLAKGESLEKPIMKGGKEALPAEKVQTMWGNTNILVAYPAGKDWHKAIAKYLKKKD